MLHICQHVKDSLEETQSEDGLDSPDAVRGRILTFLEARQLAGEKWTAQAIAQKLDIPLEIAQIAVLNPIGQNIKVPIPDISALYSGTLVAGDSANTGIFCDDGICKLLIGGIVMAVSLSVNVLVDLWNNFFAAKTKDVPSDDSNENGNEKSAAKSLPDLTGKTRQEAEDELNKTGFQKGKTTSGGYERWRHTDGSEVWVGPDGEVDRFLPKEKSPTTGKLFPPRVDQYGNRIPWKPGTPGGHHTGEIIH
jgi:hypothetical protein